MSALDDLTSLFGAARGPERADVHTERMRVREFLNTCRADGTFEPHCDSWLSSHSPEFSARLGEQGWIGMTWPTRFGGRGVEPDVRYAVIEELLAAGAPVAAHWFADRQVGPGLLRRGSAELQERLLPRMASGRCFFCIGMSEPDAGSDLAAVRTRARRSADGWIVNGTKVWTSFADRAHYMLALVRTGEAGESAATALTQLIVDMSSPGLTVRPIQTLDGSAHFCEVFFDDVVVPKAMVVGEVGHGWRQVLGELAYERSGPERFLSTFPLLQAAAAAGTLGSDAAGAGRLVSRLATLRAMSERVNAALGSGDAPGLAAALVKDVGTRVENDTIQLARQWLRPDAATARLLCEAQLHAPNFTLRGGANEILRNVIGKGVLQR